MTVHGLLQTIRGMCADERPYAEIGEATARAVDLVKDLEDENDELVRLLVHGADPENARRGLA